MLLFKKLLFAILLLGVGFYFFSSHSERPENSLISFHDRLIMRMLSPVSGGVALVRLQVKQVGRYFGRLSSTIRENEALKQEIEELKLENSRLTSDNLEVESLRKIVEFQKRFPEKFIAARVVSYPPLSSYRMVMINKGSADGIRRRAAVLTPEGLVGQVIRVGRYDAEVLLITDPSSSVDARVVRTGARGLIVGKALSVKLKRDLTIGTFEYLNRTEELMVGDQVFTTGMDGVYPAGVEIGVVHDVKKNAFGLFQEADLTPRVAFDKLENVLVADTP